MALDSLEYWFSVVFLLVGLTAIVFNYAIVVLNLPHLHTLTPSSYLIFWLCLFDGTSILSDAFITISRLLYGADTEFVTKLCALQAAVIVFGQCSSLLMCFGLTLFRYIIIVRDTELPKYFTTVYTFGVIASMCLVAALPFMLGTQNQSYILRPSGIYCAPDWRVRDSKGLILSYSCLVIIVLPVGFMAYAYASMIGAVNRAVSDVKKSVTAGTAGTIRSNLEPEMTSDIKSIHLSLKFNSRLRPKTEMEIQQEALLRQSIIIVGAFFIGWTPYVIMAAYEFITLNAASPVFDYIATMSVITYEVLNPIIIYAYDRNIRTNCRRPFF